MECLVKFDYTSQQPEELTIVEGDKICNVEEYDKDWYIGSLSGKTGQVYKNCLKLCTYTVKPGILSTLEFVVIKGYVAKDWDDLTIHVGDVIGDIQDFSNGLYKGTIIRNADSMTDNWYTRTKVGKTGFFPANCVTLCFAKVTPNDLALFQFVVHSNYKMKASGELSLIIGDTITNVKYSSEGWLIGTIVTKTGIFPRNFVQVFETLSDETPNSYETVTQEVKPVVTFKEPDIPEELLCPICLDLPENEIYQCTNGHALCANCVINVPICPQCRITLKVNGSLIRNRIAESWVCTFKTRQT